MGAANQPSRPTVADLQREPEKRATPFDMMRRWVVGPRTDASVKSRLHLYVALGALFIAFQSNCTSRGWLNWAKKNLTKPTMVYMDPAGTGTLVEAWAPEEAPPPREQDVKAGLWEISKLQFDVLADTIGKNEGRLADYFFIGDALMQRTREGQDERILGSSAEKIALVRDGKTREIELRNIQWVTAPTRLNDSYRVVAEVLFYSRTYANGSLVPEKKRAYRVRYHCVYGGSTVPGKDLLSQKLFVYNNRIMLRVDKYTVEEESAGVIADRAENAGPEPGPQGTALAPTGAWPVPANGDTGGPVLKPSPVPETAPAKPQPTGSNPKSNGGIR